MATYQIDTLDPKADRLLKDLAERNLISIRQTEPDLFLQEIEKLRQKAEQLGVPTMEEITAEIEAVRKERYAGRKS